MSSRSLLDDVASECSESEESVKSDDSDDVNISICVVRSNDIFSFCLFLICNVLHVGWWR